MLAKVIGEGTVITAIGIGGGRQRPGRMTDVRARCKQNATDDRFELYKTTVKYDGDVGREQHHYPAVESFAS
jgi:hypothetical protein